MSEIIKNMNYELQCRYETVKKLNYGLRLEVLEVRSKADADDL